MMFVKNYLLTQDYKKERGKSKQRIMWSDNVLRLREQMAINPLHEQG